MAHDRSSSITWATSPEVIETAVLTHHILLLEFISITRTVQSWLVCLMLSHTVSTHDSQGRVASRRTSVSSSRQSAGPLWLQQHRYPEASPPPSWYLDGRKTIKLYYTVYVHVCCTCTLWDKHSDSNYPKVKKFSSKTNSTTCSQSTEDRDMVGLHFPRSKSINIRRMMVSPLGKLPNERPRCYCVHTHTPVPNTELHVQEWKENVQCTRSQRDAKQTERYLLIQLYALHVCTKQQKNIDKCV